MLRLKSSSFALTSRHGRGTVLRVEPSGPQYETSWLGEVPVVDAAKRFPSLVLKGGYLDGKILSAAEAQALATLESREVLLSRVAGMMKAEMGRAASMFQAVQGRFLGVLEAFKDKLPDETEGATPEPEAPAEAEAAEAPAEAEAAEAPAKAEGAEGEPTDTNETEDEPETADEAQGEE